MVLIPSNECSYYNGNFEEAKNRAEGQIILDAYDDKTAEIIVEFTSVEEKDNTYYLFGKCHKIDKFDDTMTAKFEIEYKFENEIYYTTNIKYV